MRHSTSLLSIALLTFSCFNPDLNKVVILCPSGLSTDCPDGQTCILGRCNLPSAGDLSADLPDALSSDMPGDLSTLAGCKNGAARRLGAKARGCVGTFAAGAAAAQCGDGAVPCTTYAGIDAAACASITGFFVADAPAYYFVTQSNETCGTSVAGQLFYGCGTQGRAGVKMCGGYLRVIDLGVAFTSSNGSLAGLSNQDPANGILCCLP